MSLYLRLFIFSVSINITGLSVTKANSNPIPDQSVIRYSDSNTSLKVSF